MKDAGLILLLLILSIVFRFVPGLLGSLLEAAVSAPLFFLILVYFHKYYPGSFRLMILALVLFGTSALLLVLGFVMMIHTWLWLLALLVSLALYVTFIIAAGICWILAYWRTNKPHFRIVAIATILSVVLTPLFIYLLWHGIVTAPAMVAWQFFIPELALVYAFWCEYAG